MIPLKSNSLKGDLVSLAFVMILLDFVLPAEIVMILSVISISALAYLRPDIPDFSDNRIQMILILLIGILLLMLPSEIATLWGVAYLAAVMIEPLYKFIRLPVQLCLLRLYSAAQERNEIKRRRQALRTAGRYWIDTRDNTWIRIFYTSAWDYWVAVGKPGEDAFRRYTVSYDEWDRLVSEGVITPGR